MKSQIEAFENIIERLEHRLVKAEMALARNPNRNKKFTVKNLNSRIRFFKNELEKAKNGKIKNE